MAILSDTHHFLFIHIYKTGGSSIREALAPYCQEDFSKDRPGGEHLKGIDVKKIIGPEKYDRCFKFCFVRNPWDLLVSFYFYIRQDPNHEYTQHVRGLSFEEYVVFQLNTNRFIQKEWLCDGAGRKIVDFIGRFERLQDDFDEVCRRIGVRATLPWIVPTKHEPYPHYYDDRTAALVESWFQEDIQEFGYRFGA